MSSSTSTADGFYRDKYNYLIIITFFVKGEVTLAVPHSGTPLVGWRAGLVDGWMEGMSRGS